MGSLTGGSSDGGGFGSGGFGGGGFGSGGFGVGGSSGAMDGSSLGGGIDGSMTASGSQFGSQFGGMIADGPDGSKQGGMAGGVNAVKGGQLVGALKMYGKVEEVVGQIVGGAQDAAGALKDGHKALAKMVDVLGAQGAAQEFNAPPLNPTLQQQQALHESIANKRATGMASVRDGGKN